MFKLSAPLSKVSAITPRLLKSLEKLDLKTVGELVFHFPSRYEDFSKIYRIEELEPGQQTTISGLVKKVDTRRSWRRRMTIVEALIEDESGSIRAVWFNQPYLKNIIRPGRMMNFSGKVSISDGEIYLSHPDYELTQARGRDETRHTGRLVPIYPETRGLTSRGLRFIIQPILRDLEPLDEFIPPEIIEKEHLVEINEALQKIHFPDEIEEVDRVKRRFAFQNLFLLQLFNIKQKLALEKERAPIIKTDIAKLKTVLESLPFELTQSQKKSLWEIIQDLEKGSPMNRLIQGDVGSGKTIVAALAALLVARDGSQSVLMAPTEVLANQHFETIKKFFLGIADKAGVADIPNLGLITSAKSKIYLPDGLEAEIKKLEMIKKVQEGELGVVVGTHALIQKSAGFKDLGLVVIDEQHRFGVRQRQALLSKTTDSNSREGEEGALIPHFLSMSATPIPRTLMLTIFGDLDISVIDEMPKGRKKIDTRVVPREDRLVAYKFIREQVKSGRQAFVICPRIEKPEEEESGSAHGYEYNKKLEVKSVKEEYEKLAKRIFPELKVGMLHGQMKSKEKEEVMSGFKGGEIQILVSTSVIEVGVDIPNATIMMIEGSDRFGLAQLYQFRGRVGRGKHQSYCFLFTDSEGEATKKRLGAIVEAKNGFELAEHDLKLRGPGEFLGTSQTGLPDVAMRGLQNPALIKSARESAVAVFEKDQPLKSYPRLKEKLNEFTEKLHQE